MTVYNVHPYLIAVTDHFEYDAVVCPKIFEWRHELQKATPKIFDEMKQKIEADKICVSKIIAGEKVLYQAYKCEDITTKGWNRGHYASYGFLTDEQHPVGQPLEELLKKVKEYLQPYLKAHQEKRGSYEIIKSEPLEIQIPDNSIPDSRINIFVKKDYVVPSNKVGVNPSKVKKNDEKKDDIADEKSLDVKQKVPEQDIAVGGKSNDAFKNPETEFLKNQNNKLPESILESTNIAGERKWFQVATHDSQGMFHFGRTIISASILVAVVFCIAKFTRKETKQSEKTKIVAPNER